MSLFMGAFHGRPSDGRQLRDSGVAIMANHRVTEEDDGVPAEAIIGWSEIGEPHKSN